MKYKCALMIICNMLLIATLLTACDSSQTTTTQEETIESAISPETEVVEVEEVVEPEIEEEKQEVVQEKEEEPIKVIDMESTLPGIEWIATFDGIIEEPTAVIYNDETNKKIIIKEGDEVEFSRTKDTLALYSPNIKTMTIITTVGNFYNGWVASVELPDAATSTRQIICEKDVCAKGDTAESVFIALYKGEHKEYKFTLKFVE